MGWKRIVPPETVTTFPNRRAIPVLPRPGTDPARVADEILFTSLARMGREHSLPASSVFGILYVLTLLRATDPDRRHWDRDTGRRAPVYTGLATATAPGSGVLVPKVVR